MVRRALVTGANRGIGLAVCRELARRGVEVVLTARDPREGEAAARALAEEGGHVEFETLDVADPAGAEACAQRLAQRGARVDILVNNAGVLAGSTVLGSSDPELRAAFEVHFWGTLRTCRAFVPAMVSAGYGRVVNVSSGWGSIGEGLEGPAPYSLSKAALNALTVKLAQELPAGVKVNAACPGWVRTRMGGAGADLSPEEGAEGIVWLATLPDDGPTGGFFRGRRPVPW